MLRCKVSFLSTCLKLEEHSFKDSTITIAQKNANREVACAAQKLATSYIAMSDIAISTRLHEGLPHGQVV